MSVLLVVGVFVFAGCGALLRFGVLEALGPTTFPYATLIVNALGSFLLGGVFAYQQSQVAEPAPWVFWVSVGLLGALTTFSSFALDSLRLIQQEQWALAGVNLIANNLASVLLCFLGFYIIKTAV